MFFDVYRQLTNDEALRNAIFQREEILITTTINYEVFTHSMCQKYEICFVNPAQQEIIRLKLLFRLYIVI